MIDPFDSYKLYNALKLHFETDGYDAIKYNYKSNVSAQSFFKRRDKYFFAKVAKNYEKDLLTYFVSNFKNGVGYVGDMINEEGQKNYLDHKRIQESIHRVFSIDINIINDSIKAIGKEFSLTEDEMNKCLADKNLEEKILNERIEAQKNYKVSSTPTIYINEKKYKGSRDYKTFKKAIDKLL